MTNLNSKKVKTNQSLNEKLDLILKNQKKILENEKKILGSEDKIIDLENKELKLEKEEITKEEDVELELSKLEKEFSNSSIGSPIKNITKRDLAKGFIGSFLVVIGHFSFSKAAEISKTLTILQSTILYLVAAIIIFIMLYFTGFRNVKKHIVARFLPLRAILLYSVSIFTIILVNLLFGKIHFPIDFFELYNLIGASIIIAVMGAGTADLIGKN